MPRTPLIKQIRSTNKIYVQFTFCRKLIRDALAGIILLQTLNWPVSVFANEGAEKPAGEHGAKSEGEHGAKNEGEHGAKAEGEGGPGFIKKDEFLEINSAIEQLNAKIRTKKEDLKKLLVDKDSIKNPVEFKGIVKKIENHYRELNELIETIKKKEAILRYRFPDRSFVKNEENSKIQRIEEIGAEAIIEKEVNQLLKTTEAQYQYQIRPETIEKIKSERSPASEHDRKSHTFEEQNPEDFSKSLIIRK